MLTNMYSFKDTKAGVYYKPWHAYNHGDAERKAQTITNDPKAGDMNLYPHDFDLYYIGQYEDTDGKLITLDTPQHIIKLDQLVEKTETFTTWHPAGQETQSKRPPKAT